MKEVFFEEDMTKEQQLKLGKFDNSNQARLKRLEARVEKLSAMMVDVVRLTELLTATTQPKKKKVAR